MSRATARIGKRSDIALSDVSFWVNVAYQEVAQAAPGALMETLTVSSTTSGENRLELPADCMELINLSWLTQLGTNSARTLRRTSVDRADQAGFSPNGKPTEYTLFNNWLELWPSPDSSYSLQMRYYAYPTDMSATTAVPSLATEWRPAVLYLAEAFLHEHVGNDFEGASARARYATYVASLKDTQARRQSAGGMRIQLAQRTSRY
jgi:hypothetical protein